MKKELSFTEDSEKLLSTPKEEKSVVEQVRSILSHEKHSFEIQEPGQVEEPSPKKNTYLGYLFMFIAISGFTCGHIFSKIAFTRNPALGGFDCVTFFGIWLSIVYITWAKILGVQLSVTNLPKTPLIALLLSLVVTFLVQLGMFKAISWIPVGKSTLIYSTNPIFSVVLSFLILREKLSKPIVFSAIGALIGIYFLSLNKKEESDQGDNLILGVILVVTCAWLQAVIFILVRIISSQKIHFTVRPANVGMFFIAIVVCYNCFLLLAGYPSTFQYDLVDIILLSCVGIGACLCIGPLSLAMQYEEASKLSPLLYTENIFTLLADALVFGYTFVKSDYIGISIVGVCLLIPVFIKLYAKK
ncbi:unnamed protein product [Moneuplotes crassus]|uniref:EamA domain-containing protein n=1 Tax=Euplotes crassus TaxID=5936 RepID=A0AAD1XJ52_EUPCR|nr:unnamed protein product [Moneuplotes crassus]